MATSLGRYGYRNISRQDIGVKTMSQSYEFLNVDKLTPSQLNKLHDVINLSAIDEHLKAFQKSAATLSGETRGVLKNTWKMDEGVEIYLHKLQAARAAAAAETQRKQQEDRFRRLVCLFIVTAKMAKADGHVDASEVKVVERLFTKFNITNVERTRYVEAFNSAVKNNENVYWYVDRIAREFTFETRLFIYELLWDLACADGIIVDAELSLLKGLCGRLGLSENTYNNNFRIRRKFYRNDRTGSSSSGRSESQTEGNRARNTSASGIGWAYALIGGNASMTNDELKSAYRSQAKTYHPDVLRAKGIPEDLIEIANVKMVKLNEAWVLIRKERGI